MDLAMVVAVAVALAFYVECGRRTLQVLILTHLSDPTAKDNYAFALFSSGRAPVGAHLIWWALWAPIMLLGWVVAALAQVAGRPRTSP